MKPHSLTIRLEADLERELEAACAETGRSRGEIGRDALRRQLQLMRFERLRRQAPQPIARFAFAWGMPEPEARAITGSIVLVGGWLEVDAPSRNQQRTPWLLWILDKLDAGALDIWSFHLRSPCSLQPLRTSNATTMEADRGALFCATGSFLYLEAALISALTLRQHEPCLPITLVSDCPEWQGLDLRGTGIRFRLVRPDLPAGAELFSSRWIKTRLASLSPYRDSLYVDADMLTRQPLGPLWLFLEEHSIGLVPDIKPLVSLCDHVDPIEKAYTLEAIGGDAQQFNCGLMLWRAGEPTATLFQHWHQEWRRFARQDQLALVRAIARSGIQVAALPASHNTSPRDARGQPVHLLHCWGNKVQRGMFRRFAAVHCPKAVADAQSRLQSLDRSVLAPQATTRAPLPMSSAASLRPPLRPSRA